MLGVGLAIELTTFPLSKTFPPDVVFLANPRSRRKPARSVPVQLVKTVHCFLYL
jgi:hypothetical protein